MADNDQNDDEYKFAELDSLDHDSIGESELGLEHEIPDSTRNQFSDKKDVKRNALIAVGLIVFAMVMYKLVGYMFSSKTEPVKPEIAPITQVTPQPVQTITPVPAQQVQPVVTADPGLSKKVSAIEIAQQSIRSEVSSLSDQVNTVNASINNLNAQITTLSQTVNNLANQVARQSDEISILMSRTRPKQIKPVARQVRVQPIVYYIQAVIPGRAWLIGTNGSTLTVRDGTKIPGYGVVKLIDSIQGRILTSSGQVIRFSQDDS